MYENLITLNQSPIFKQFQFARKNELASRGVLDIHGNIDEDKLDEKMPSVFHFRNDDPREQYIKNAIPLWGDIWFENECMCIFGDPNIGKSALAFQIADYVARLGYATAYFDFENMVHHYYQRRLTPLQSNKAEDLHVLHFAQHTPFCDMTSTAAILDSIENSFLELNTPAIVIDDISYICQLKSNKKTNQVLRRFRYWINKYHISILVIAHATAHHDGTPLALKHLTGDRQLAYAFDSIISLNTVPRGTTTDGTTHYIKQLKARNSAIIADSDNVWTLALRPFYSNLECDKKAASRLRAGDDPRAVEHDMMRLRGLDMLHFEFLKPNVSERSLLFLPPDAPKQQLIAFAHDCFSHGWSIRDIAAHTALSKSSIHRLLTTPEKNEENLSHTKPTSTPAQEKNNENLSHTKPTSHSAQEKNNENLSHAKPTSHSAQEKNNENLSHAKPTSHSAQEQNREWPKST